MSRVHLPIASQPTVSQHPISSSQGVGQSVYIETYGCQMNVADTTLMTEILGNQGYTTTKDSKHADVILINTCAVREKAEDRVFARAHELAAHKKSSARLGIVGCMAEHLKASILDKVPSVDIIAGPDSYRRLPQMINNQSTVIDTGLSKKETYEALSFPSEQNDTVSGFVTIQRGCDKCCTFCIVPLVRGRERGVPPRDILRQVHAHVAMGYKEIVLLGQTVNSYCYEDVSFSTLLQTIAQIEGIKRIRFTSPYPLDFTEELIETIATEPKICHHIHLPLQSGSNDVLKRMHRGYTRENFISLVKRIRDRIPSIAISTDILSSFCGETDLDHQATLNTMKEIRFDSAFMFRYSERSGTYASRRIKDDVSEKDKKHRLQTIVDLQHLISKEIFSNQIGNTESILIHSYSKRNEEQVIGRTNGFKSVILSKDMGKPGDIVNATITGSTMATLFGVPTSSSVQQ